MIPNVHKRTFLLFYVLFFCEQYHNENTTITISEILISDQLSVTFVLAVPSLLCEGAQNR